MKLSLDHLVAMFPYIKIVCQYRSMLCWHASMCNEKIQNSCKIHNVRLHHSLCLFYIKLAWNRELFHNFSSSLLIIGFKKCGKYFAKFGTKEDEKMQLTFQRFKALKLL
jgi:hypothetical protein